MDESGRGRWMGVQLRCELGACMPVGSMWHRCDCWQQLVIMHTLMLIMAVWHTGSLDIVCREL